MYKQIPVEKIWKKRNSVFSGRKVLLFWLKSISWTDDEVSEWWHRKMWKFSVDTYKSLTSIVILCQFSLKYSKNNDRWRCLPTFGSLLRVVLHCTPVAKKNNNIASKFVWSNSIARACFLFLLCTLMTSANKSLQKKIFHQVENVIKQLVHTSAVCSSRYEALGSLESTQEARVAIDYPSSNSYVSFVLSKLHTCFIFRWTHANVWTNC